MPLTPLILENLMMRIDNHHICLQEDNKEHAVPVRVEMSTQSILVFAEGYGNCCAEVGFGPQVCIELHNGEPRVIIWADYNSEEPTHIIPLGGAKEHGT